MKKTLEALTVVCLMAVPGLVLAQPSWDFSASLFGARVWYSNTDVRISDSSVNSDLTAHDVKLDNGTSFGGKLEAWNTTLRGATGMDFGLGLDVTRLRTKTKEQQVILTGRVGTFPVSQVGTLAASDAHTTAAAFNVVVRRPFGVSSESPYGTWYPYLGAGAGKSKTELSSGGNSGTDTAGITQFFGGVNVFVSKSWALFAEYKHVRTASQTFMLGTQKDEIPATTANQVAVGAAFHF